MKMKMVEIRTNKPVGTKPGNLAPHLEKTAAGRWKKGAVPELWDGKASERIVRILVEIYQS